MTASAREIFARDDVRALCAAMSRAGDVESMSGDP